MSQALPLDNVRIIDLTHYIAGPYCTKLFADLGADVIKIEKPETGDGSRHMKPFAGPEPHPEKSATFLYLNTNKRSICLDLKDKKDQAVLKELIVGADILVENFKPGTMESLGLDYQTLERINPRLVMTSISNFGQTGPYRDWAGTELTLSSFTGMMRLTGQKDRAPVKLGLSQVQYTAGVTAAVATMGAYNQRLKSNRGQHVDVSLVEPMINTIHQQIARYGYWGAVPVRGETVDFPFFVETENAWIHISPLWLDDLADFVGLEELQNEKFTDLVNLMHHTDEFKGLILPWFRQRDGIKLFHDAQERGIPWAPVHDEAALLACPQLEARDYFKDIDHPVAGTGKYPGLYFYSDQIEGPALKPAPLLGQHTDEVLAEMEAKRKALGDSAITKMESYPNHTAHVRPLEGLRILSTEHWAALPHANKYLASLGAEIITVESHNHAFHGVETKSTVNGGGLYQEGARNKCSVTLDLSTEQGVEIFKRLVKISDVVTDNFSPRVMKNLGLDYDALKKVKPDIIVMSLSGYGHKGPWYLYRGYAVTTEAAGGLVNFTGYNDGPPTRPGGTPFGDMIPALHTAWTLQAAFEHHRRTGKGAFIDMSMIEPCIGQLGEAVVHHSMTGESIPRMGNRDMNAALSGCYPCLGQDNWVTVAITSMDQWKSLLKVMGNPAFANDGFDSLEAIENGQDKIDEHISAWTATRDYKEIARDCQDAGVPAGPVLSVRDVMSNEHYLSRGSFEVIQHPPAPHGVGTRLHIGPPWYLSRTPASTVIPASDRFGRDNDYVYGTLLGMSDKEMADLTEANIIGTEPPDESREILINQAYFGVPDEDFMDVLGLWQGHIDKEETSE